MYKQVTMTLIAEEKGSVAWHGDTGHNAFGIIMNLIDEQMKKEGKAEQVCFSIVVEGVGGQSIVTSPDQLQSQAQAAMVALGLLHFTQREESREENLCHECQDAHSTYFSGGQELCGTCAREVGWLDVLEDY